MLKTEEEALKKSITIWNWLVKNFPKDKWEHRCYTSKIEGYINECPLCDYHLSISKQGKIQYDNCKDCCLDCCINYDSLFETWDQYVSYARYFNDTERNTDTDYLQALMSAKNIVKTMKARLKELTK